MNFFSSIFSDDSDPSEAAKSPLEYHNEPESENRSHPKPNPNSEDSSVETSNGSNWDFGGLFKTIATRSESVIGTYRRDLEEFRSGLIKETSVVRDVATRAVKEFPDSIDAGASVAQEKLETVGKVFDTLGSSVFKGTADIIARSKELHLFDDDDNGDERNDSNDSYTSSQSGDNKNMNMKKYSWFDARMNEIQCDLKTYGEDPDDLDDYSKWRSEFVLHDMGEEIMNLMENNRAVEKFYLDLVPVTIDRETFWSRYYYRVYKLKQVEEARARIVKRAISGDCEEELSWDVDDEDNNNDVEHKIPGQSKESIGNVIGKTASEHNTVQNQPETTTKKDNVSESAAPGNAIDETEPGSMHGSSETNTDVQEAKLNEGKISEGKSENDGSCKDSDVSIVSTQPLLAGEEDELGWDEIEDVGSDDDKTAANKSSNVTDLHKRPIVSEDDEDLSWDIEDDDEPVKS